MFTLALGMLMTTQTSPIDADISECAWIVGDWHGGDGKVEYEELWLPPKGGSMVGVFRLIRDGNLTSITTLNLTQDGKKIKMILRGLTPDLNPAGEKANVLHLVAKSEGRADFVNQTEGAQPHALHVTKSDDRLKVVVESLQDGATKQTELNFRLAKG